MTVELRKPMVFEVANHVGDDNDNSIYRWSMIAYSFDDIAEWHTTKTVFEYSKESDISVSDTSSGDDTVCYLMFDRSFTCDSCDGSGFRCKHGRTHDAYTSEDLPYVECPECEECRYCEGAGSSYIPLHDDLYLEESYAPDSDTDIPEWHDLTDGSMMVDLLADIARYNKRVNQPDKYLTACEL